MSDSSSEPPISSSVNAEAQDIWINADLVADGYYMASVPNGTFFVPVAIGFIAHAGVTPGIDVFAHISVGIDGGNPTKYANNVPVNITSPYETYDIPLASRVALMAGESFIFKLITRCTAAGLPAKCQGRFFVKGLFVELPYHA